MNTFIIEMTKIASSPDDPGVHWAVPAAVIGASAITGAALGAGFVHVAARRLERKAAAEAALQKPRFRKVVSDKALSWISAGGPAKPKSAGKKAAEEVEGLAGLAMFGGLLF